MILQALTALYEDLVSRGALDRPGWSFAKISYALCLDEDGTLLQVVPTFEEVDNGKKTVLRPQQMVLPAAVKRSSGVASNFLWDNSSYLLGVDEKGKPERSIKCFEACRELHRELLGMVETFAAKAIVRFFEKWEPAKAVEHPALQADFEKIISAANLVFRVNGTYAQQDEQIAAAWQAYYESSDAEMGRCLITGKVDQIEATHPSIKGVDGAQSSGAALVSFNAPAFCSYGHEQNFNAPVGKYAAFAYTAALNYLLADRQNVNKIGDTTVVCWAEGADPVYQQTLCSFLFGQPQTPTFSEQDLRDTVKRLAAGLPATELALEPDRQFYILGLAPNAARLSVRFFHRSSFGDLLRNINAHYERMEIVRPSYEKFDIVPLWVLLRETVNQNSRDKAASPIMVGSLARAIFSDSLYPAALLENVMLRIRAERDINYRKAAIIKAYYLKNQNSECPKEVLTVSLNEESCNPAYVLGRLFAIYEAVQEAANPGINTTIKDRFLNSAAATPATIFPILDNLYQKHLRKLKEAQRIYYDRITTELKGKLAEAYPSRLSLPQQGSFNLGYYHQLQKRFEKKESN